MPRLYNRVLPVFYYPSYRNASAGSCRAALRAGYQIAKKTTSAKTPPVSRLMAVKRITPQGTISATARFRQISKPGTEAIDQQQQALADHQPLYTLAGEPIAIRSPNSERRRLT